MIGASLHSIAGLQLKALAGEHLTLGLQVYDADRNWIEHLPAEGEQAETENRLAYVSDWLSLWLVTGQASWHTCQDFTVYLQVVAVTFADVDDFTTRPIRGLVRPSPTVGDTVEPASPAQHPLPAALGRDMYAFYARSLAASQRIAAIDSLLHQPGLWRSEFA
jgi:hypothetical protein